MVERQKLIDLHKEVQQEFAKDAGDDPLRTSYLAGAYSALDKLLKKLNKQDETPTCEEHIDFALVRQKDSIYKMIHAGNYAQASIVLEFVKEFWSEFNYTYKYTELRELLNQKLTK